MRIVLPIHEDRISPVFDVSRRFVIVNVISGKEVTRKEVFIEKMDPITRAKRVVELRANFLICGAISWPLEIVLVSAGIHVISNTCGPWDKVMNAFITGELTEQAFLMPGCRHRRYRNRGRRRGPQRWNI